MIQMQEDVPTNHPSGRLPILDLEVWVHNGKILHSIYKKPMSSRLVVQARTAFSTQKKMSILLEEGQRRLRNCSPEICWTEKVLFLNRFSSDLRRSGHLPSFRKVVLKRVIQKYRADLSNHLEEKKTMYRTREERKVMQNLKGNCSIFVLLFCYGHTKKSLSGRSNPKFWCVL